MEAENILSDNEEQTFRSNRLVSFFRDGKFVDCTFKIDGREVRAHKLILACGSPVFEKMLFGNMASDEITLDDVDLVVFNQMLNYIYTGSINIMSVMNAWSLFYVAKKYLIDKLITECLKYISSNLTMSTLALSYEYSEFYNLHDLKRQCFHDIVESINAVFCSDYHIKPSTLRAVLKEHLFISNVSLMCCIIEWAINECEFRNLKITPHSVVGILEEENILKHIYKDWIINSFCEYCSDALAMCQCVDEIIHKILILLSSEVTWQEVTQEKKVLKPVPFICKSKRVYKIARRIDLLENEEFVSSVSVNTSVSVFGVFLCTEMKLHVSEFDVYDGTMVVRFCEENSSNDIVKPTIVKNVFVYNSQVYVPLRFPVTLTPGKMYDIRISYRNLNSNLRSSVICSYMTNEIVDKARGFSKMYFYDISGTIIKGIGFYPV